MKEGILRAKHLWGRILQGGWQHSPYFLFLLGPCVPPLQPHVSLLSSSNSSSSRQAWGPAPVLGWPQGIMAAFSKL